ncbi:prepilin-type N-terminal cleavage/methylation domain-containing protein [Coxiella burnetii]|uniref:Uncharacterized protein n=2 Tax=Coxiella burnetii TaxID=777 RepID=Q83BM2_COXBU|nr:prepilin-type N-terminal cleavage/methylation domain-containing protein [Coxiella burnetii]NP_820464.1 hypothetical protein CBU_1481 [Coxiella burnetii RSA 493]AAO90978.1 hypothetical protein CBU_1481 [Coxiella burnetii RSA 493]ACJ17944.1 hypothetical protein CbuG_0525 [Coxiella burnetii CbuG_Q212]ARI66254.1 pilus assembly protein PilV [Coxiella burnetii]ARK27711.1 pilus assembly protein PilV [Coxiella burnetii]ATN66364.1 pilus assembly protein PilV [Coxiella burnetii]
MSHSPSYGFTLLEVLIAWSILSGILLSVLFLQIDEVRHIRHAYYYSVATVQLRSLIERLRANQTSVAREREWRDWNNENKGVLPQGEGNYRCERRICHVTVHWRERKIQTLSLVAAV